MVRAQRRIQRSGRPRRAIGAAVCCLLALACLAGRLYVLQVRHGPGLAAAGLAQRARVLPVASDRGAIVDRNGLPLTAPALTLDLVLFPGSPADPERAADLLVNSGIGLHRAAVLAAFSQPVPVVLKAGLSLSEAERAQAVARDISGLLVVPRHERTAGRALAAHVLGPLLDGRAAGAGIEAGLDRFLSGSPPVVAAFVDGNNRLIPGLAYRYQEPADGQGFDVYLTLSAPWQAAAEDALAAAGGRGAAVVIDSRTGELLALASAPPPPASHLNRTVLAYAPGSVFKTVVLSAALAHGVADLDDEWRDSGLTVRQAFAQSDNGVFADLGTALGAERLIAVARAFGLGARHEIGLPGEEAGALPVPDEIEPWDLRQLSIGQGPLTVTPLQAAAMLAAVANGGQLPPLQLVKEVRSRDGLVVWRPPAAQPETVMTAAVAQDVRRALAAVTEAGSGTLARVDGMWIGGKTGTAEAFDPDTGEPVLHAWFGGIAETPHAHGTRRLAIVVFLADGNSGGGDAAPVFADLLKRALPEVVP